MKCKRRKSRGKFKANLRLSAAKISLLPRCYHRQWHRIAPGCLRHFRTSKVFDNWTQWWEIKTKLLKVSLTCWMVQIVNETLDFRYLLPTQKPFRFLFFFKKMLFFFLIQYLEICKIVWKLRATDVLNHDPPTYLIIVADAVSVNFSGRCKFLQI